MYPAFSTAASRSSGAISGGWLARAPVAGLTVAVTPSGLPGFFSTRRTQAAQEEGCLDSCINPVPDHVVRRRPDRAVPLAHVTRFQESAGTSADTCVAVAVSARTMRSGRSLRFPRHRGPAISSG
ncbi:hypothetical protein BIV23_20545 [Streptomyces monashensis]|uniref:Uncharacterized protein n=1 Tax=Streptomyces monashensis TaxID=1678012 RepID=A0A1S2QBX4_9ACTN|nr:hypothetical protein BIV23_20545 [Streptomyces monashensis]